MNTTLKIILAFTIGFAYWYHLGENAKISDMLDSYLIQGLSIIAAASITIAGVVAAVFSTLFTILATIKPPNDQYKQKLASFSKSLRGIISELRTDICVCLASIVICFIAIFFKKIDAFSTIIGPLGGLQATFITILLIATVDILLSIFTILEEIRELATIMALNKLG